MSEEIRKMPIHKVYDYAEQLQHENNLLKADNTHIRRIRDNLLDEKEQEYHDLASEITRLEQENQQLKEEKHKILVDSNGLVNANGILQTKLDLYKSVLEETREYCNLYTRLSAKDILQTLDKVKGE